MTVGISLNWSCTGEAFPLGARASSQQLGLGLPSREGADGNVGFLTSSSNSITKRPFANSL